MINSRNENQRPKKCAADKSLLMHICSLEFKREVREEEQERKRVRESKRKKRERGGDGGKKGVEG